MCAVSGQRSSAVTLNLLRHDAVKPLAGDVGVGEPDDARTVSRQQGLSLFKRTFRDISSLCAHRKQSMHFQRNFPTTFLNRFFIVRFKVAEGFDAMKTLNTLALLLWVGSNVCFAAESADKPAEKLFPDKNLEAAVRKYVFDKRDNDKPLTEADVANLSTIQASGGGITNLAGLEKCQSLAMLELPKNKITNLAPLKSLPRLQFLNLAHNEVEDLSPLGDDLALQYIDLTSNRVSNLKPIAGLTNLASLYLSRNRITDLAPILKFSKLASLYLDGNRVQSIAGIQALKSLSMLSLNGNQITDLSPIDGLTGLYYLFLERNKIRDLSPLVAMAKKDDAGEKRFAPFLNVYLKDNPLSFGARHSQISELKAIGTRVNF
jgi:internalin A